MAHRQLSFVALSLLALGATWFEPQAQGPYAPLGAGVRRFAEVNDARTARVSSWDQTGEIKTVSR